MGYNDNRIFKTGQKIFQPVNGFHIQMVSRLVQKQNVRIAKESLCQKDTHLFLGGKVCHLHGVFFFGNAQTV